MTIPQEVKSIIDKLERKGFEAYVVGGCVRDLLRNAEPRDWDIATSAKPEEVGKIFLRSYTDNKFGTVTVLTESKSQELKEIEITTYRVDEKYTDKRHPDEVHWARTIKQDLSRRDFTVNAMAISYNLKPITYNSTKNKIKDEKSSKFQFPNYKIIDPFGGQRDLENKTIRAVGNSEKRFNEDALRMLRAVRFAVTLGENWAIEEKTAEAIKENSPWLQAISKERIRDEFVKIVMADKAMYGIELLRKLGLLRYIIPEIEEGYGVTQNKHHIYGVYEHLLRSLDYAVKRKFNKYVRIASLLHDIGKPRTKNGEGPNATFYNHEVVGAKMTAQILNRLKFSKKDIEKITKLVRYHLFYYHPDEVGESSVRRLVRQVGPENTDELLQVRMADRIGSGVPKAEPYKLRYLRYVIEKVSQDPITVKRLLVNGNDIIKTLNLKPGIKIGQVLDILLSEVLDNPSKNKREYLEKEIRSLGKVSENELEKLAQEARKEREKLETKRDQMTKKKYWVM